MAAAAHDRIRPISSVRLALSGRVLSPVRRLASHDCVGDEVITRAAISGAIASRRYDRRLEGGHVARKVRLGHRAVATTMTLIGLCFGASGAHRGCAQRQLTQCLPIGTRRSFARGRVGTRFATDAGGEATLWRGLRCRCDRASRASGQAPESSRAVDVAFEERCDGSGLGLAGHEPGREKHRDLSVNVSSV
jgi:hypothetical protein